MTTSDTAGPAVRVLAVHDDSSVRDAIHTALVGLPLSVVTASEIEGVADEFTDDAPEVVLCRRADVDRVQSSKSGARLSRLPFVILLRNRHEEFDESDDQIDDVVEVPVDVDLLRLRLRTVRRVVLRERQLRELARQDSLTGLPNRRACDEALRREWERAVRYGRPLSCAVVDVDRFKSVNDERGHLEGDRLLARIGAVAAAGVRSSDFAGRYGGDEFLLLLPETELAAAQVCCERLVEAVTEALQGSGAGGSEPTITVGVGERTPSMQRAADLVAAADANLRAGKRAGGNRVAVAD